VNPRKNIRRVKGDIQMKYIGYFFYYLIQFTWGLVNNLIGALFLLANGKLKREFFHGACLSYHNGGWGGVSMGIFIFVNGNRGEEWVRGCRVHEYGHTLQSLLLGPLYMFVIGIPSFVWCNSKRCIKFRSEKGITYGAFYPEKWANAWGAAATGEPALDS
jgi:hypothetical protein